MQHKSWLLIIAFCCGILGLADISSRSDETQHRQLNHAFYNDTGAVKWVAISVSSYSASGGIAVYSNESPNPNTLVGYYTGGYNQGGTVTFPVLPGDYYIATANGANLVRWIEWK